MAGNADDTVVLVPRPRRRRPWPVAVLAVLLALAAGGAAWFHQPPAGPIATADEAQLAALAPAALTPLRFGPNPAILVLGFPSLAEQGRMLNRVAALVEKAGLPHDRLLTEAELAAAIRAAGVTPETYYYGHDYRSADVQRFFMLAERDHVALNADEQHLQRLAVQASAVPPGFGAVITLPPTDAASGIDQAARATILHHELSHGEYFTNPAYAAYVGTVWRNVFNEDERARFRTYLVAEGYDPALEDLLINEMQAYMMFTPDPRYFDPAQLGIPAPRLAQIRAAFAAGMPPGWLRRQTAP